MKPVAFTSRLVTIKRQQGIATITFLFPDKTATEKPILVILLIRKEQSEVFMQTLFGFRLIFQSM